MKKKRKQMIDKFFGYTPEKMALAKNFIKDGVNSKNINDILECFNKLFNKNEKLGSCTQCSAKRYRQLIVNFVKNGEEIWKKHNLYEQVISLDNLATDEDIDNIFKPVEEQQVQVDKPKRGRPSTKNKSENAKNK